MKVYPQKRLLQPSLTIFPHMPKLISNIVKALILSDFFINLGWGLMAPIFAIFIVQNITVGSVSEGVKVAGFASLFYWITKSTLQIPIGHYLDKNHGERDDYWWMVAGTFMMSLVPLGYIISNQSWHIYALQIFYGVSAAMILPSFAAIFTRHINKGREALTWSTYSTCLGGAAGVAGGIGGIAVATFGFKPVLVFISVLTFIAATSLLVIKDDISPKNRNVVRIPIERK